MKRVRRISASLGVVLELLQKSPNWEQESESSTFGERATLILK